MASRNVGNTERRGMRESRIKTRDEKDKKEIEGKTVLWIMSNIFCVTLQE